MKHSKFLTISSCFQAKIDKECFLQCCYLMVDPETHPEFALVSFSFIYYRYILNYFHNFILEPLYNEFIIYGTFVELNKFRFLSHAFQNPPLCSSILPML
jgi:hypothetical protein